MIKTVLTLALVAVLSASFFTFGTEAREELPISTQGLVHCSFGVFDFEACLANPLLTQGDCIELRHICESGGPLF